MGRPTFRSLNLGPARGLVLKIGLWILPEPWKTQNPRFPPFLGRRSHRAAHSFHKARRPAINKRREVATRTQCRVER